ncbi:carbohydrate kinase family protein [Agromyces sp. H3Y2-19a]|uniref:carbohydrate kinase family protein n=1 Tax=Agromyces TaxID=33877 RepID=UPI001E42B86E|nr:MULTISPECIES: carbohydrate kinase family protein [Agromyces]MCD5345368.1 carbohydrate kinase family protein [Agromyces sp. S2-1-8]MDF0513473.1 carbohydrate kinase family protein [Agromyces chromiiresistens]
MTANVFIAGPASWNRIVLLDRLPEPVPHMQFALSEHETVGGTSAGKALGLAGLGRRPAFYTLIGADADGARVSAALQAAGVELIVGPTGATERHLNLMTPAGERVSLYLSSPGEASAESRQATEASVSQAMADAAAIVLDLAPEAGRLIPAARATGRPIWTDIHDYDGRAAFHRPFIEAADAVFMNADGIGDPVPFLRTLIDGGASIAVCTLGAEGAVALDAAGREHRVDAAPVDVLDTNGAGDAFMSGVLDATLDGAELPEALAAGARHAASVLTTRHLHPALDAVLGG